LHSQGTRRAAGLASQGGNAGDGRIGASRVDDTLSLPLDDEGARHHGISSRVLNRHAFAADHGLVHREGMRDGEREISADPVSWSKDDEVATHQLACVDDPQLAVAAYPGAHRQ
jgi:hypothetical protein